MIWRSLAGIERLDRGERDGQCLIQTRLARWIHLYMNVKCVKLPNDSVMFENNKELLLGLKFLPAVI